MAALVAPNLVRYTIEGTYAGQEVANIFDYWVIATNPLESREEALYDQCGDILNNWDDHILSRLASPYTARAVSWVDLESLDGSVGRRSSTDDNTWPKSGGNGSQAFPGNVALRVDKLQNGGRRARNGRTYLVGLPEVGQGNPTNNEWDGTILTEFAEAMGDFLDGTNSEAGPDGREVDMVVIHTVDGVYNSHSNVTGVAARANVASQRRRLNW